jgi:hypothetical protein
VQLWWMSSETATTCNCPHDFKRRDCSLSTTILHKLSLIRLDSDCFSWHSLCLSILPIFSHFICCALLFQFDRQLRRFQFSIDHLFRRYSNIFRIPIRFHPFLVIWHLFPGKPWSWLWTCVYSQSLNSHHYFREVVIGNNLVKGLPYSSSWRHSNNKNGQVQITIRQMDIVLSKFVILGILIILSQMRIVILMNIMII